MASWEPGVGFTDDGGNDETLTSAATEAVAGNEESAAREDVAAWSATITVEWVYQGYGYYSTDTKKAGSLSPASFEVDGTTYTVKMVETQGWWTYIGVDRELPFDFVLELDGKRFASNDASFSSYSYGNIYRWKGTGLSLRDGDTVEVRLLSAFEDETAVNSAATGAPVISGTVQVGETLTADTTGIADEDGLDDAVFGYQWLADAIDISGAKGSTYTLADADENKAIKVKVSFTDDAGNDETLTSAATDAVSAATQPNNPATGAPTVSGTVQVGETLTADTSGIADADGLSNATFSYQWLADDAAIAGATDSTHTLADADEGKAIKVRVSFTDDGGNDETLTSAATDAVAAPELPANPPFSLKNWGQEFAPNDPHHRFDRYSAIPPKTKGDLAFLLHMLGVTNSRGMVGVVMPHGILFRGGAEGKIRQGIVEADLFEAIIGLAPNLFFGASIPVAICVLNKAKPEPRRGKVLFIDAAQPGYFRQGKAQNFLDKEHIKKIVEAYEAFEEVDRFAHLTDLEEIKANDFNLNISRYVDTTEPVEVMSVEEVLVQLREAERRRDEAVAKMDALLAELGYDR